ncbi:DNA-processing protein DprA [Pectinatus haikarae]|uniref:DNA-processing protein DprA n=1 Tax=Pectinatus haikarae TaxID=349096 RepID=UPI0018C6836C|nr:DNA-processing protein DprA [Pectinatus haikarae]
MEKYFLAALQMVSGIGNASLKRIVDYFGSAVNAWNASDNDIEASKTLAEPLCKKLFRHRKSFDVDTAAANWESKNIKLLTAAESEYPELLKNIYNPPAVLFCRGCLHNEKKHLAVVGSRKFSVYGKSLAETFAADLAGEDFIIVSGAAHGIDTFAHRGALSKGKTVAVLGCGIDVAYPRENKKILDEIAEKGAVISEYAPGTQPLAAFFPARNRIISGISLGTVVVEAAKRSGSLITAEMAISEGRDVFAVPGSVYSEQSEGCNHLIQQGAKLVVCAGDIIEEYGISREKAVLVKRSESVLPMSLEEKKVYDILAYEQALGVDEIIYKLRTDVSNISFILLQMKLKKIVEETLPGMYVRSAKGRIH